MVSQIIGITPLSIFFGPFRRTGDPDIKKGQKRDSGLTLECERYILKPSGLVNAFLGLSDDFCDALLIGASSDADRGEHPAGEREC